MNDVAGLLIIGAFGVLFVGFAIFALRRARQRRRAQFAEDTPTLAPDALPPAPEEADDPASLSDVPTVVPVPEPLRASPASEVPTVSEERVELEPAPSGDDVEAEAAAPAVITADEAFPDEDDFESATEDAPAAPVLVEEADEAPHDRALQAGLEKTRTSFLGRLTQVFKSSTLDPAVLDDLEDVLLQADVGVSLTMDFVDALRDQLSSKKLKGPEDVKEALKERLLKAFAHHAHEDPLLPRANLPRVILFVGVNGVGKTTTIGKIASRLRGQGHDVVLAAGDTFRAAAAEQLGIWGDRTGAKVIRGEERADPASVIFNAIQHGKQTAADVVLADTAGRLHTKSELMDEIQKVKRAASKARDGAPDEVWLVVDATTGQNALQQAKEFHQALGLSGVILTKLDGTAKGGVVVAISDALNVPVRFVGVGEQADDLRPFEPRAFVDALFEAA